MRVAKLTWTLCRDVSGLTFPDDTTRLLQTLTTEMKSGLNLWTLTRPDPEVFDPATLAGRSDKSSVSAKSSKVTDRFPRHKFWYTGRWSDPTENIDPVNWFRLWLTSSRIQTASSRWSDRTKALTSLIGAPSRPQQLTIADYTGHYLTLLPLLEINLNACALIILKKLQFGHSI